MDTAQFLRRRSPRRSTRDLADYIGPPGAARYLRRIGGRSSARTLSDYLPDAGPAAVAVAAPVAAPERSAKVGEARASERRLTLNAVRPVITVTPDDLPRSGSIRVTLTWDVQQIEGKVRPATDVHLGCLWETVNDHRGVVQSAGQFLSAPGFGPRQILRLERRREDTGESLMVYAANLDTMRRMVLFGYGRTGAPNWALLGCRLTVSLASGARVVMWLDEAPSTATRTVVIATVHLVAGDLILRRENEYLPGPVRDVAEAYGWDLDWNHDGTAPRLDRDR